MNCDWTDPTKREGEHGKKCYVHADHKITRTFKDKKIVSYRCVWHVPPAETHFGEILIEDVGPRYLNKRQSRSTVVRDETLRGY